MCVGRKVAQTRDRSCFVLHTGGFKWIKMTVYNVDKKKGRGRARGHKGHGTREAMTKVWGHLLSKPMLCNPDPRPFPAQQGQGLQKELKVWHSTGLIRWVSGILCGFSVDEGDSSDINKTAIRIAQ